MGSRRRLLATSRRPKALARTRILHRRRPQPACPTRSACPACPTSWGPMMTVPGGLRSTTSAERAHLVLALVSGRGRAPGARRSAAAPTSSRRPVARSSRPRRRRCRSGRRCAEPDGAGRGGLRSASGRSSPGDRSGRTRRSRGRGRRRGPG